jgi:hypothetical protein
MNPPPPPKMNARHSLALSLDIHSLIVNKHSKLPRGAASTANSCACSPTCEPTTISRPSDTSKSSVTVAASSSSNTGARLGWHVLRLLRYVALPPLRVAAPRNLPPLKMAYDESDNERHVDGFA